MVKSPLLSWKDKHALVLGHHETRIHQWVTQIMSVKPSAKLTNKERLLTNGFNTVAQMWVEYTRRIWWTTRRHCMKTDGQADVTKVVCVPTNWLTASTSLSAHTGNDAESFCANQIATERKTFPKQLLSGWPSKHVILCQLHEDLIQGWTPGASHTTLPYIQMEQNGSI